MALSSSNWLIAWISMEVNLIRFIPIILSSHLNQETEAAIKYFLAQALGSALILLARIALWTRIRNSISTLLLLFALLIKLGAAPCHFWFPSVITSASWITSLVLVTWQKLAPLSLLIFLLTGPKFISRTLILLASINALLGGLLGLNQTHIRTILAYSSITHIGWILGAISISSSLISLTYFIIYSIVVAPLFIIFNKSGIRSPLQFNHSSLLFSATTILLLIRLGGLPPLTGFLPKWLVINLATPDSAPLILSLIIGSLINLYFYLNISFSLILNLISSLKPLLPSSNKEIISIPIILASCRLGLMPIITYAMTLLNKS